MQKKIFKFGLIVLKYAITVILGYLGGSSDLLGL